MVDYFWVTYADEFTGWARIARSERELHRHMAALGLNPDSHASPLWGGNCARSLRSFLPHAYLS
jgi:hypothetical protein